MDTMQPAKQDSPRTAIHEFKNAHGDVYAQVFLTATGGLGIEHEGRICVKRPEDWMELAWRPFK